MAEPNWQQIYRPSANLMLQGNPALDDLKNTYAKREAQRAQDEKEFTSEMAKLNFNGARAPEIPELQDQYQKILKLHQQTNQTNDPKERAMNDLKTKQEMNSLLYNISASKDRGTREHEFLTKLHDPNVEFADGATQKILGLTKLGAKDWDSAYADVSQNLYAPKAIDLGKTDDEIFNRIKSESKETGKTIKDPITGLYGRQTLQTTKADKQDYLNSQIQAAKNDVKRGRALMKQYGTNDISDAVAKHVDATWPIYKKKLGTDTTITGDALSFAQRASLANMRSQANQVTINQPPQEVKFPVRDEEGNVSGEVNLDDYTPLPITKASMIPNKGINQFGKSVYLPAGEVSIVANTNVPVLNQDVRNTKTKEVIKKGSMAQSRFQEQNPDMVEKRKLIHIKIKQDGVDNDYFVEPKTVNTNITGAKNQAKAMKTVKSANHADNYGL